MMIMMIVESMRKLSLLFENSNILSGLKDPIIDMDLVQLSVVLFSLYFF